MHMEHPARPGSAPYGAGRKERSGTGLENSKSDSHIETSSQEMEIITLLICMHLKVILEIFRYGSQTI